MARAMVKAVLITGASSVIGAALSSHFAKLGCRLLLIANDVNGLSSLAEKCRNLGAPIVEVASIDVTDTLSMSGWISEMDARYNIDIVVANASIVAEIVKENHLQAALDTFNTNVTGVINTIQPCIRSMQERGRGNVVIISSTDSLLVTPNAMTSDAHCDAACAYGASQRFLRIYGEAIRPLYAEKGVKVHVICSSSTDSTISKKVNSKIINDSCSPEMVVRALSVAMSINAPLVVAPMHLTFIYSWLLPFIPLALQYAIALWRMKRLGDVRKFKYNVNVNSNPKNILITGASSGLGAALSMEYAANDVNIALFGRNIANLDSVAKKCQDKRASVNTYVCDVTSTSDMSRLIRECDDSTPLDLVIVNAGISTGVGDSHVENTEQIDSIIKTNLIGALNTIEPSVARMKERGRGQIIVISSALGLRGIPGQPSYCASKAALLSYAQNISLELSEYNIGITIVCCGPMDTPMSPGRPQSASAISIEPEICARHIRLAAARDVRMLIYPFYIGGLLIAMNALLPRRLCDWIVSKLPRRTG